jgi:hypothetical protein
MKIKPLNIFLLVAIAAQSISFIPTKAEAAKKSDNTAKVFNSEQKAREYICAPLKGADNALCKMAVMKVGSKRFSELGQTTKSAPAKVVKDIGGVCKTRVTNSLKSPASARYPNQPQTKEIFQGIYVVTGKVDAQNTYGALLRNSYHCYMYYSSDNKLRLMGLKLIN